MSYDNAFEAKIAAVNAANAAAVEWFHRLRPIFLPLVGTKIHKAGGALMHSVERLLPELPNAPALTVRHDRGWGRSLIFGVKTCRNYANGPFGEASVYHDVCLHIGDVQEGRLTGVWDAFEGDSRTDYNAAEIRSVNAAVARLKEQEGALLKTIGFFGYSNEHYGA